MAKLNAMGAGAPTGDPNIQQEAGFASFSALSQIAACSVCPFKVQWCPTRAKSTRAVHLKISWVFTKEKVGVCLLFDRERIHFK